jgi:hypothetical protein
LRMSPTRRAARTVIGSRFDGNLTVEAYIRHPWQPDFSKTRARCGIRSTSAKPRNEIFWCLSS